MTHGVKKILILIVFMLMIFLHFDFWWFDQINPLLFGFMPFAVWFQALVGGILASIFLFYAYKVIWPDVPEVFDDETD
ncbi:hypothetical protein [Salipaludibacillus sp. CF4.18]|uniref:hypothetical protein n=1 Tax=Salipaludibacillus sp. CF4.18 TaxID=3373081 RepID=UPI003EE64E3E